jgi:hypothetical protein
MDDMLWNSKLEATSIQGPYAIVLIDAIMTLLFKPGFCVRFIEGVVPYID